MMMAYGLFVFGLGSAPYQTFQRQMTWRHAASDRVGQRPVRQYLGPGDDLITLAGTLLPEITGGQQHLDDLRDLADRGYAWPLIEGTGVNYGVYVIESLDEDKSVFFNDGLAQQIDFTLKLARVDDNRRVRLGTLTPDDVSPARLGRRLRAAFS